MISIEDDDLIVVPPLKGFVMNRVQGDYFENLLYKVFVTISEHVNMTELTSVLQIPLQEVKVRKGRRERGVRDRGCFFWNSLKLVFF